MEILLALLGVIVVLLVIYNFRTIKKLKESKIKYEENEIYWLISGQLIFMNVHKKHST